ncbi:hypothetical protein ACFL6I_19050 [candidate division KSB1 bacterium]
MIKTQLYVIFSKTANSLEFDLKLKSNFYFSYQDKLSSLLDTISSPNNPGSIILLSLDPTFDMKTQTYG